MLVVGLGVQVYPCGRLVEYTCRAGAEASEVKVAIDLTSFYRMISDYYRLFSEEPGVTYTSKAW